jgi:hypothetical protein
VEGSQKMRKTCGFCSENDPEIFVFFFPKI